MPAICHSPSAIIHWRKVSTPRFRPCRPPASPPRAWDRNPRNAAGPGSERFDETSRDAGDCSHDHASARPTPSDLRMRKHGAGDRPDDAPYLSRCQPPRLSAGCPPDRSAHATGSVRARSSGSPPSLVTPNVSTTACPGDISIGDRGDISIGDLHPLLQPS